MVDRLEALAAEYNVVGNLESFVDSFCDPRLAGDVFQNQLRGYTPCFTDVVLLGVAHVVAILLCTSRIYKLFRREVHGRRYRLLGWSRGLNLAAAALSALCAVIVLFQVHGRVAYRAALPLTFGGIASYESGVYAVSTISWILFAVMHLIEDRRYSKGGSTWLPRFAITFITSCQLAKLRLVLQLSGTTRNYYFVLFVVYVVFQLLLVLNALVNWPPQRNTAVREDLAGAYWALLGAEVPPAERICPESVAGIYNYITFGWVSKLLVLGYQRPLVQDDVWNIPLHEQIKVQFGIFSKHWEKERATKKKPSLILALWKTTMWLYITMVPLKLVSDVAVFAGPIFLGLMVNVVDSGGPIGLAYVYAALMVIGLVVATTTDNHHYQVAMRGGYRMRGLLANAVFRKVLALSPSARTRFSSGFIFNLVTQDTEQLQLVTQFIAQIVSSPIRIVISIVLLYIQLGPSALLAPLVFALTLPYNAYLGKLQGDYLNKSLEHTDERAKVESELLAGVEVVKCATWEGSFLKRIQATRTQELKELWTSLLLSAVSAAAFFLIPEIVAVACFGLYVGLGNNLSASRAFTALSLFTIMRIPLYMFPQLISMIINTLVGLRRMQDFLSAEEQPGLLLLPPAAEGEDALVISGDYTWDHAIAPSLRNIDLRVPKGALVAVVGQTGSGKTSLLSSAVGVLQHADESAGTGVAVRGTVAYVSQSAFLYNATVRDNILFGGASPPDEERYQEAIRVSSLTRDLSLLPAGDLTELGDRGVNVSGGQKQRISIARAYYANADIYLFDDPLSALDAKVGRAVFGNCLDEALAGRTRVLVTNQLQFVSASDWVVFMQAGRITEQGTYKDLMSRGGAFTQMMAQAEHGDEEEEEEEPVVPIAVVDTAKIGTMVVAKKNDESEGKLTVKEGRSTGRLSAATIMAYVNALGGRWTVFQIFAPVFAAEACFVGSTFWLAKWTADNGDFETNHPGQGFYLGIFALIGLSYSVFSSIGQVQESYYGLKAAEVLHNDMLVRILRAPMRFFHTTPLGRTINRLTKDISDVDKNLSDAAYYFCHNLIEFTGTVITIAISTPFALPIVIPVLFIFFVVYSYFQASAREVKRLDAVTRSPLYGTINEAINGVPTIRAYRMEQRLAERNSMLVDENIVMSHAVNSLNRWLSTRLEAMGALTAFGAAVLAIQQKNTGSQLGLTVTYALVLAQILGWNVMNASMAENSFNSVDRIAEYCAIEQEPEEEIPGSIPPGWPAQGRVEWQDVQMRYRPGLPLVLRGLSVTVDAGTKCGVVGRTGAGKSSLINSLFRLMELDAGRIVIDGVDIAKIGLKQLRSNLSLIPQVPVLFSSTLRANIDPFEEHDDTAIWQALRRAHLAPMVEGSKLGLDMVLSEGGQPLSAGQKQLVALTRALLKHSKVLVLDEATANVDVETDALIQKTVREEFKNNTIIAVAHRLHTVIDTDSVLVMDAGQAAEFGSPAELLSRPGGMFSSMVEDTGEATAAFLRGVANGEISIEEHLDSKMKENARKQVALARVAVQAPVRAASSKLAETAQQAVDTLSFCLAAIREDAAAGPTRQELGLLSPLQIDAGSAQDSIAEALAVVADIQALAERMRGYVKHLNPPAASPDSPESSGSSGSRRSFEE